MPLRSDGSSYTEVTPEVRCPEKCGKADRIPFPCPPVLFNPYGQVWEHVSVLIRILKLSVYRSV